MGTVRLIAAMNDAKAKVTLERVRDKIGASIVKAEDGRSGASRYDERNRKPVINEAEAQTDGEISTGQPV